MSHCFWVARQEFFCHVCSSTTCNCLLSLLKSNTSSPFFPLSKMPYIANAACYFGIFMHMWILHAHILKFWFSPINLSVFIWFLAQLEELRRWKEKHFFFKPPHSTAVTLGSPFTTSWGFPCPVVLNTLVLGFHLFLVLDSLHCFGGAHPPVTF